MIVTEPYKAPDRNDLVRTYSDEHKYIIQDGTGVKYEEAIDPISMGRTYTESDEYIPDKPEPELEREV